MKENAILRDKASYLVDELDEITKNNKVDYTVVYGEFMYQAGHSLMKDVLSVKLKNLKIK